MAKGSFESSIVNLKFSLHGDFTDTGVDLLTLGHALTNAHSLFDRTYSYYAGCQRLSKQDRQGYKIIATDIKRGSIIIDTQLILDCVQGILPLTTTVNAELLWETTSTAFKYLLTLLTDLKENRQNQIKIIDSPGANIYFIQGEGTISVSPAIHNVASSLRPAARRLSETFKNGEKGDIQISSPSHPNISAIHISDKSAPLFQSHKILTDVPIAISGQVKSYHSDTRSGDFYVPAGMAIPDGKYLFTISPDCDEDTHFIDSLKGYPMPVLARIEYDLFTSLDSRIVRLYLAPRLKRAK